MKCFYARHAPSYSHLHVFGYLCYSNVSASAPHKLSPRSTPCILLGYAFSHKGFRCLDPATGCIIPSRHVVFDESTFPLAHPPSPSIFSPSMSDNEATLLPVVPTSSHCHKSDPPPAFSHHRPAGFRSITLIATLTPGPLTGVSVFDIKFSTRKLSSIPDYLLVYSCLCFFFPFSYVTWL